MAARGYTLVEVIVAVTVLAVGVLGAAASAVPVARLVRWGGALSSSAAAAGSQLETLRARACPELSDGAEDVAGGLRVRWTVAGSGRRREVTVTVAFPTGEGFRSETFGALMACGQ
jgi:prepilin-type N-terminal cleavage/methylation domain-containing protein